jgi:hypothetical protein
MDLPELKAYFLMAIYVIPLIIGLIFWGNKLTQNKEDKDE